MNMGLESVNKAWDRLAETDPLWAVCVVPGAKGNGWNVQEFYATGEQEVAESLARAAELGLSTSGSRALDFGCGVGRLTFALAERYDEVCGVDISSRMLKLAEEANPRGDRCRFIHNQRPDLSVFDDATFDLVYSSLVLQHMETEFSRRYLAEFGRVLRPGGTLTFHLPARTRPTLKGILFRYAPRAVLAAGQRYILRYPAPMEMHCVPEEQVRDLLSDNGMDVVAVEAAEIEGSEWQDLRYFARKR
jgi:ubiquinone/menaquinone biosynthesis C-methylase UbiE